MPTNSLSRKKARLYAVLLILAGTSVATGLVLAALRDTISYFRTPTEIVSGAYPEQTSGHAFRLGGMVEKGSLHHDGAIITFRVTDFKKSLDVHYEGVVPNLFREGQGVVAEGKMGSGPNASVFMATTLLAKHDEKYMPPEIAREMKNAPPLSGSPPL